MTEKSGEIQGKLDLVQVSEEFKLSEFELSGFCIYLLTLAFDLLAFLVYFQYPAGNPNVWICLLIISLSAMQLSTEIHNSLVVSSSNGNNIIL